MVHMQTGTAAEHIETHDPFVARGTRPEMVIA